MRGMRDQGGGVGIEVEHRGLEDARRGLKVADWGMRGEGGFDHGRQLAR